MKGTKNKKRASPAEFAMPGVDVQQLEKLIDFMAIHGLEEFEYEHSGLHIRIRKASPGLNVHSRASVAPERAATALAPPSSGSRATAAAGAGSEEVISAQAQTAEELHIIKSPIVGTFYAGPGPEAASFVRVGDTVQVGKVVCIVEAMKLMNEIEADVSGEVVRALVENAQPVEYGQGLFAIRPTNRK